MNARPQERLDEWLAEISETLAAEQAKDPAAKIAPFAVNQICHGSNDRLAADMETCVEYQVPIIITSLRPPAELVAAAHSYGGVVFHDVINLRHARRAISEGVDGIIAVCAGAGGHAGTLSPFALVKELRAEFDGTILLSGAMANGQDVLAAQAMGADLAYIGSRFIATAEANADPAYKQMLVDSVASDIVYSSLFTGVHGNYLKPSIEKAGLDPNALPEADKSTMNFGSGGNTKSKAWRDIWGAGQGVGSMKDVLPVGELIARMRDEYEGVRQRLLAGG